MKLLKIDKLLFFWTFVVLVAVIMPIPPGSPVNQVMSIFDYADKIIHFILFSVFAFLLAESLLIRNKKTSFVYTVSFATACAYAAVAELLQAFVPTRTVSVVDFVAGVIGTIIALLIIYARDQNQR